MATQHQQQQYAIPHNLRPWAIYDLFLDVPHPAASASSAPATVITASEVQQAVDPANSIEQELSKTMPQISRFAFPEYDEAVDGASVTTSQSSSSSGNVALNKFDRYAMQSPSFQNYTFSLQLQSGMRVHGHVRRYMPVHNVAKGRYDIGRRSERALVILTRASGGDAFYAAILKTMETLCSQQSVMDKEDMPHAKPLHWFLHELDSKHRYLSSSYAAAKRDSKGVPVVLSVSGLEFGKPQIFGNVDSSHFMIPPCLLHRPVNGDLASFSDSSILPLLRRLHVAHTLRLMSALLGERRVLLISSSPTRLAACARSAIAILAQGMLHWHHIYIPVLPPHLWQYLAAPVPYIIGILSQFSPRLDRTDGLGELLIINLDKNAMETRGMAPSTIQKRIPDLFLAEQMQLQQQVAQLGQQPVPSTASEVLAQNLVELVKNDKKTLFGESTLANVAETTAKATKALKTGFMKLKHTSTKFLQSQRSNSSDRYDSGDESDLPSNYESEADTNTMAPDYIYIEACRNEAGEQDARTAFASFFLSVYGNMRWYLSGSPGQVPQLDKNKFLEQRRALGDSETTPMGQLLMNFVHSQMLEEFVKERVEEIKNREPVTPDSPFFLRCSKYIIDNKIDWSTLSVNRVTRQMTSKPSRRISYAVAIRRDAMAVTSKKTFEGDHGRAVAQLVERCRESGSVLFDVMSVIWMRMRDSRGLNWKNALHSLQLLRNLLFHGPLAAVAEATDGLAKVRAMKFYKDNMRTQNCQEVRIAADNVYNLLVDRSKLFAIRRVCANRRRVLRKENQGRLTRDTRLTPTVPFKNMHPAMRPRAVASYNASSMNNQPTVAVIPPSTMSSSQPNPNPAEDSVQAMQSFQPSSSMPAQPTGGAQAMFAAPSAISQGGSEDLLGLDTIGSAPQSQNPPSIDVNNDLLDIFSNMAVANPSPVANSVTEDPFAAADTSSSFQPQPPEKSASPTFGSGAGVQDPYATSYSTGAYQRSRSKSPGPPGNAFNSTTSYSTGNYQSRSRSRSPTAQAGAYQSSAPPFVSTTQQQMRSRSKSPVPTPSSISSQYSSSASNAHATHLQSNQNNFSSSAPPSAGAPPVGYLQQQQPQQQQQQQQHNAYPQHNPQHAFFSQQHGSMNQQAYQGAPQQQSYQGAPPQQPYQGSYGQPQQQHGMAPLSGGYPAHGQQQQQQQQHHYHSAPNSGNYGR